VLSAPKGKSILAVLGEPSRQCAENLTQAFAGNGDVLVVARESGLSLGPFSDALAIAESLAGRLSDPELRAVVRKDLRARFDAEEVAELAQIVPSVAEALGVGTGFAPAPARMRLFDSPPCPSHVALLARFMGAFARLRRLVVVLPLFGCDAASAVVFRELFSRAFMAKESRMSLVCHHGEVSLTPALAFALTLTLTLADYVEQHQ
jgi:hypothetical protein